MKFEVKSWWFKNEQTKAGKYNFTICWDKIESLDGSNKFFVYGEKVAETAKAEKYNLYIWNLNKSHYYRYVTDIPAEKKWNAWIPKSAIIRG